jgi:hypothetical protein
MGLAIAIPTKRNSGSGLNRPESCEISERAIKTLRKLVDSKLNTVCRQHKVAAQAAASNSNLRWLRVQDLNLPGGSNKRRLPARP